MQGDRDSTPEAGISLADRFDLALDNSDTAGTQAAIELLGAELGPHAPSVVGRGETLHLEEDIVVVLFAVRGTELFLVSETKPTAVDAFDVSRMRVEPKADRLRLAGKSGRAWDLLTPSVREVSRHLQDSGIHFETGLGVTSQSESDQQSAVEPQPVFLTGYGLQMIRQIRNMIGVFFFFYMLGLLVTLLYLIQSL